MNETLVAILLWAYFMGAAITFILSDPEERGFQRAIGRGAIWFIFALVYFIRGVLDACKEVWELFK